MIPYPQQKVSRVQRFKAGMAPLIISKNLLSDMFSISATPGPAVLDNPDSPKGKLQTM